MSTMLKRNCGVFMILILALFAASSLQQVPPRVEFAQLDSNAEEGSSNLELTVVVRNAHNSIPVSVIPMTFEQYASSNMTICDGVTEDDPEVDNAEESDFDPTVITKNISSGETTFTVNVVDDAVVEPIEELLIILSTPENTTGRKCVLGVIKPDNNDDVSVVLNINGPTTVSESVGQIDYVQLVKHGETEKDVTISIELTDRNPEDTARAGVDYVFDVAGTTVSGQLKLAMSPEETVLNLPITVVDDEAAEYDETLEINVQWSIGKGFIPLEGTITIEDNDYVLIGFTNATAHTIVEGESIRICASILNSTASFSRPYDYIRLTDQPGTAIADKHYTVSTVRASSPSSPVCIAVTTIDDGISEGPREFEVIIEGVPIFGNSLSPLTIIDGKTVTVEIRDNDGVASTTEGTEPTDGSQTTTASVGSENVEDSGLPVGAIVGIIIGAIILALCCCLCVVLLLVLCLWGVSERERKYFPANKEREQSREYENYRSEKEKSASSESSLSYEYEV